MILWLNFIANFGASMEVTKSPNVAGSKVNPVLNALKCNTLCKNTDTANNAPPNDKLVIKRIPIPVFKLWFLSKLISTKGIFPFFFCLFSNIPKATSKITDNEIKISVVRWWCFKHNIPKTRLINPLTHKIAPIMSKSLLLRIKI